MNISLTSALQEEVIRIGDWLLTKTRCYSYGWAWPTVRQKDQGISWQEQSSIYNGVGGLVLFFLALYRYTRQDRYLEAARQGVRWMTYHYHQSPDQGFALLTGQFSLPWVLLQLYNTTGETELLTRAQRQVASPRLDRFRQSPMTEFINGTSGTLLGLLHLHAAAPHDELLLKISAYVETMLAQIRHGRIGCYWDRSADSIHGLCGLSHGAGGVGWVFLELGRYFNNPAFYWVAEQAFAYENQYYDHGSSNWLDLRKGIFDKQDEQAYQQAYDRGDLSFFTTYRTMNAWCHGAAGIGLARLRACELLPEDRWHTDAVRAVEKTVYTDIAEPHTRSFTLCHGSGGNAELLIEAAQVLRQPRHRTAAETIAQRALASYRSEGFYRSGTMHPGEDASLFMGTAGIGYFYLRLLSPRTTPSVLLPKLTAPSYEAAELPAPLKIASEALQHQLFRPLFRRTLLYLERTAGAALLPEASTLSHWVNSLQRQVVALPHAERLRIRDVFRLERHKLHADWNTPSDTLLHYAQVRRQEDIPRLLALTTHELLTQPLVTGCHLSFVTTAWRWESDQDSTSVFASPAGQYDYLLLPTLDQIEEQSINPFCRVVLTIFQQAMPVSQALDEVYATLGDATADRKREIQSLVLDQIREAMRAGLLIDPDRHLINALLPTTAQPPYV